MASRTHAFAGLIGSNRYSFGGLEDGFGRAGLTFSASGATAATTPLTGSWGGLISYLREIQDAAVSSWSNRVFGVLSGTVQDIAVTLIPEVSAILNATVTYSIAATKSIVGTGGVTFTSTASGRAARNASGSGALSFSASGVMTPASTSSSLGAGEGRLTFAASATGSQATTISLNGGLAFTALAAGVDGRGVGNAGITFVALADNFGTNLASGTAGLALTASAVTRSWAAASTSSEAWSSVTPADGTWTPVDPTSENWNG